MTIYKQKVKYKGKVIGYRIVDKSGKLAKDTGSSSKTPKKRPLEMKRVGTIKYTKNGKSINVPDTPEQRKAFEKRGYSRVGLVPKVSKPKSLRDVQSKGELEKIVGTIGKRDWREVKKELIEKPTKILHSKIKSGEEKVWIDPKGKTYITRVSAPFGMRPEVAIQRGFTKIKPEEIVEKEGKLFVKPKIEFEKPKETWKKVKSGEYQVWVTPAKELKGEGTLTDILTEEGSKVSIGKRPSPEAFEIPEKYTYYRKDKGFFVATPKMIEQEKKYLTAKYLKKLKIEKLKKFEQRPIHEKLILGSEMALRNIPDSVELAYYRAVGQEVKREEKLAEMVAKQERLAKMPVGERLLHTTPEIFLEGAGVPLTSAGVVSGMSKVMASVSKVAPMTGRALKIGAVGTGIGMGVMAGGSIAIDTAQKEYGKALGKTALFGAYIGGGYMGLKPIKASLKGKPLILRPKGLTKSDVKIVELRVRGEKIGESGRGKIEIIMETPEGKPLTVKGEFKGTTKGDVSTGSIKIPKQVVEGIKIEPQKIPLPKPEVIDILSHKKPFVVRPVETLDTIAKNVQDTFDIQSKLISEYSLKPLEQTYIVGARPFTGIIKGIQHQVYTQKGFFKTVRPREKFSAIETIEGKYIPYETSEVLIPAMRQNIGRFSIREMLSTEAYIKKGFFGKYKGDVRLLLKNVGLRDVYLEIKPNSLDPANFVNYRLFVKVGNKYFVVERGTMKMEEFNILLKRGIYGKEKPPIQKTRTVELSERKITEKMLEEGKRVVEVELKPELYYKDGITKGYNQIIENVNKMSSRVVMEKPPTKIISRKPVARTPPQQVDATYKQLDSSTKTILEQVTQTPKIKIKKVIRDRYIERPKKFKKSAREQVRERELGKLKIKAKEQLRIKGLAKGRALVFMPLSIDSIYTNILGKTRLPIVSKGKKFDVVLDKQYGQIQKGLTDTMQDILAPVEPDIVLTPKPKPKPQKPIPPTEKIIGTGVPLIPIFGAPMGIGLGAMDSHYKTITKHLKHKIPTIEEILGM